MEIIFDKLKTESEHEIFPFPVVKCKKCNETYLYHEDIENREILFQFNETSKEEYVCRMNKVCEESIEVHIHLCKCKEVLCVILINYEKSKVSMHL